MDRFQELEVTSSFMPVLWEDEDEIICSLLSNTRLYFNEDCTGYERGTTILTTHRYMWLEKGGNRIAVYLHLSFINEVHSTAGFLGGLLSTPKITVFLHQRDGRNDFFQISFLSRKSSDGGSRDFLKKLESQLVKKPWVTAKKKSDRMGIIMKDRKEQFDSGRAGIGGIMQMLKLKDEKRHESLSSALCDMDKLMESAQELVGLAKLYREQMQKRLESVGESASSEELSKFTELNTLLLNVGISSTISRTVARSAYHELLARQIADFLFPRLEKSGGVIPVVDAYCLFNRARGTDMISPEDMKKAVKEFEKLELGLRVITFPRSKVQVIQKVGKIELYDDIIAFCRDQKFGASEVEVASTCSIPVFLAQELLLEAEQKLELCRDESIEGVIRFYQNLFVCG